MARPVTAAIPTADRIKHGHSVAAKLRNLRMVSAFNDKSPKGEAKGYLTAMVYLAPHVEAGGKSLCPHSTEACRVGCLYHAGRGTIPQIVGARLRRARLFLSDRAAFFGELMHDLDLVQRHADHHGLKMAVRLNGTSDVLWEREPLPGRGGRTLFDHYDRATFYDYTRTPLQHRRVPENWKLTLSLADAPLQLALDTLAEGHSLAAIVPEAEKKAAPRAFIHRINGRRVRVVDGDVDDLRFLDPPGALVLLKPKGRLRRGGPMVRHNLIAELRRD